MSELRCHISISLDGFVAGPNQSEENPLGEGGERLHEWVVPLAAWRQSHGKRGGEVNESARIVDESRENIGAGLMGRNMFGPVGGGPWGDEQWTGWWGEDPPYHSAVFILTHHPLADPAFARTRAWAPARFTLASDETRDHSSSHPRLLEPPEHGAAGSQRNPSRALESRAPPGGTCEAVRAPIAAQPHPPGSA